MIKSVKHFKNNQLFRDLLLKKTTKNVMNHPKMDKISISLTNKEVLINSNKLFVFRQLYIDFAKKSLSFIISDLVKHVAMDTVTMKVHYDMS